MMDVEARLEALDTSLFNAIPSQLFEDDRRSLLALQRAVRRRLGGYHYLEIGSYRGGSLQTHLLDPFCHRIYSIDKRPRSSPDDRGPGVDYGHSENSTAAMMEGLRRLAPDADSRIATFESDSSLVNRSLIRPAPELCFIDGEHTEQGVMSDFAFCRSVAAPRAIICFHDINIVFPALSKIVAELQERQIAFEAYALPSYLFVIELGGIEVHSDPAVAQLLLQNWRAILPSLMTMEHYREVYNRMPVRLLRTLSRGIKALRRRVP